MTGRRSGARLHWMSLHTTAGAMLSALVLVSLGCMPLAAQDAPHLQIGSAMPMADTELRDARNGQQRLSAVRGEAGTAVVFWSNQCPWIERYEERLMELVGDFEGRGISFVLVNSNDARAFPQESQNQSMRRAEQGGYPSSVTYLMDPSSRVARAFGAARTPHVFLFDAAGVLVYAGAVDDSPGDPSNVQEAYVRNALEAVAAGAPVSQPRTRAFGCTIKFSG